MPNHITYHQIEARIIEVNLLNDATSKFPAKNCQGLHSKPKSEK